MLQIKKNIKSCLQTFWTYKILFSYKTIFPRKCIHILERSCSSLPQKLSLLSSYPPFHCHLSVIFSILLPWVAIISLQKQHVLLIAPLPAVVPSYSLSSLPFIFIKFKFNQVSLSFKTFIDSLVTPCTPSDSTALILAWKEQKLKYFPPGSYSLYCSVALWKMMYFFQSVCELPKEFIQLCLLGLICELSFLDIIIMLSSWSLYNSQRRKKQWVWVGKIAQQVKALATKLNNMSSVLQSHMLLPHENHYLIFT